MSKNPMMLRVALILFCLLTAWGGSLFAGSQFRGLTLNEAIELAFLHHPAVRTAELDIRMARLELETVRIEHILPTIRLQVQPLSLSAGEVLWRSHGALHASLTLPWGTALSADLFTVFDHSTDTWTLSYGFNLSQKFTTIPHDKGPGSLFAREGALIRAETAFKQVKDEVVLGVIEQFSRLLAGEAGLTAAKERLNQAEAHLSAVEIEIAEGRAGELQRMEAELAVKAAEITLGKRSTEQILAQEKFGTLLAIEGLYEITPPEFSLEDIMAAAAELVEMEIPLSVIQDAEGVRKARQSVEAAEQRLSAARAAALPTASLAAGWTPAGWSVGVIINFDLFSPGRGLQVELARTALEIAQERRAIAEQEAKHAVTGQKIALKQMMENLELLPLRREKWELEERIMQKKIETDLIGTDEWADFQTKRRAFEREWVQETFDAVLVYLHSRQTLGLRLNWEDVLQ
ncbi:TolC family protein [Candidatus Bipolaricaulota bacterium]|nr:TolC family protein [Candidatus Bipolaricaulota bacterium]